MMSGGPHPDGWPQHLQVLIDGRHRGGGVHLVDLEHLLQLVAERGLPEERYCQGHVTQLRIANDMAQHTAALAHLLPSGWCDPVNDSFIAT